MFELGNTTPARILSHQALADFRHGGVEERVGYTRFVQHERGTRWMDESLLAEEVDSSSSSSSSVAVVLLVHEVVEERVRLRLRCRSFAPEEWQRLWLLKYGGSERSGRAAWSERLGGVFG